MSTLFVEKQSPFFSVVMPVYNVEKYLSQAIESVLKQSFEKFELLLIDDCSPDRSPQMCDEYEKKDSRIRVIHLEQNAGVSNARNVGMDLAKGQYLFFMDSDDYIDINLFEEIHGSIQKNPAEIVFFGMTEEHFDSKGNHFESVVFNVPTRCFEKQRELRKYMIELEKATLYGYACNKFYDLKYLRNLGLRYKEYALNEDILFNVAYCMDIERMNVLEIPGYHYRKNMDDSSRSSKFVTNYFELHEKRIQVIFDQYKYWKMCGKKVRKDLAAIYTRYIMSALQRNCDSRSDMTFKERRLWLKDLYTQELFNQVMPYGKPKSPIVKVFHFCLTKHLTMISLMFGRVIYMVKTYCPMIFNVVQKNR